MVGYFRFTGRPGWVSLRGYDVLGMAVWEVLLPGQADSPRATRRLRRGTALLQRRGCRRLLSPCDAAPGMDVVQTRGLWQTLAGPLALAALEQRGLVPGRSVVGLSAKRRSANLLRCCRYLAPRVRAIAMDAQTEGLIGWELERAYGLPVVDAGADVWLDFALQEGRPGRFALGGENPEIPGFTLTAPGLELPPLCPALPLLSALWAQGRLAASELVILPESLDRQDKTAYT